MKQEPIVFCWSGGKDSAYALHLLLQDPRYAVHYLLTTINGNLNRVSMHGIRETLLDVQAESIGIPLLKVYVYESNNQEYETQMAKTLNALKKEGIKTVAFGDIFLEDLRSYREEKMNAVGMKCLFPLWQRNTKELVADFIAKGFTTYTCCINEKYLSKYYIGKIIDEEFIKELPAEVDPCGENGEFHSFCVNGPIFNKPVPIQMGEIVHKTIELKSTNDTSSDKNEQAIGFWYCDFLTQ